MVVENERRFYSARALKLSQKRNTAGFGLFISDCLTSQNWFSQNPPAFSASDAIGKYSSAKPTESIASLLPHSSIQQSCE